MVVLADHIVIISQTSPSFQVGFIYAGNVITVKRMLRFLPFQAFLTLGIAAFLISVVRGFTVGEELAAIRRGLNWYATIHGMRLDPISVETSDGWLLEVHRVRSMRIFNASLSPPVFLSHGFGCSSFDYMANLRNESIAFILADRGFDVWAVNYRANKFSNRMRRDGHVVKPVAKDYYRATWQYMAEHDVPAILDKILETTGQEKIYLIGQSMGTTILFAFLSQNHTYDSKIPMFSAIAPVIKFGNDTSFVLKTAFNIAPKVAKVAIGPVFEAIFGSRLMTARNDGVNVVAEFVQSSACRVAANVCALLTNIFFQTRKMDALTKNNPHIRVDRMQLYLNKYPAGVTLMNAYLFAQQYNKDPWTKMDYDELPQTGITNMEEYNQTKPPAYDFKSVRVPLAMYYAINDIFTGPMTAKKVVDELGLPPSSYRIMNAQRLSHHDTLWGWDARCWMYDPIIDTFDQLELQRAGVTVNNSTASSVRDNSTSNLNSKNDNKFDKERADYRRVTIPEFTKTLPLDSICASLIRQ